MEFPTEEALKKYLEEHPDADKSNHSVKKEKQDGGEKGKTKSPKHILKDPHRYKRDVKPLARPKKLSKAAQNSAEYFLKELTQTDGRHNPLQDPPKSWEKDFWDGLDKADDPKAYIRELTDDTDASVEPANLQRAWVLSALEGRNWHQEADLVPHIDKEAAAAEYLVTFHGKMLQDLQNRISSGKWGEQAKKMNGWWLEYQ